MKRNNRVAKFTLPIDFIESGKAGKIFAFIEFTPLKVECLHYAMRYEFIGISSIFKEVEAGLMMPEVILKIEIDEETNNLISVTVADDK